MSEVEQPRDAAGRFEGGSEQLFGREAELVSAGYTVRNDDTPAEEIGSDETSLREAADALAANDEQAPSVMEHLDAQGKLDPNEAITAEQASDDFSTAASDVANYVEGQDLAKFAEQVDQARLKQFKTDPASAADFGFDANDVRSLEAKQAAEQKPADQPAQHSVEGAPQVEGLAPEVEVALKHPQVRQAIEEELGKADAAKQQYAQALNVANQYAQASLLEHFPELAEIPVDRWAEGISLLNQSDPQRVARAMNVLQRVDQLQTTQAQWQQRQAIEQQQQFEARYQEYNRQADVALGPMTAAEKTAMAEELVSYVGEFGVTREALIHEAKTNLALHHPAFQRMAADALRYRQMRNAPKAVVRPDVPPVQRPGHSNKVSNNSKSGKLAALERQFAAASGDRQLRIAAEILGLRE